MINIRIGDLVRFLTEKLEGKVTGIIDHSTVNVFVDEYGFEIPASVNDLVVIHSDLPNRIIPVINISHKHKNRSSLKRPALCI